MNDGGKKAGGAKSFGDERARVTKKERLLAALTEADGFVSGSALADALGVTRASVWKYIKSLTDEGYEIEAVTNRGYRLMETSDVLTSDGILAALGGDVQECELEVIPVTTSTNTVLKENASALPAWHAVIAGRQTAGKGRLGRSFYSPEGTGLYISVLLRPRLAPDEAVLITTAAAVAVCLAIEEVSDEEPRIKWVNDVFVRGKKVCGILTEANFDMESGALDYAVLGVGINVTEPAGGFPVEIADVAGAVFKEKKRDMRNRLAASFLRNLHKLMDGIAERSFVGEYRRRIMLIGKKVEIARLYSDGETIPATVTGIDDACRLLVRFGDGTEEALSSGEVRVRLNDEVTK